MKYRVGNIGKVVVAKFEDGEDVLKNVIHIIKKEKILAAVLYLVGGMREGKFVVGAESDTLPPVPMWRELGESHEVVGFGTVFYQGEEPKVHLHGAFGKGDAVKVGCLREKTKTFLVLEVVILELCGIDAVREFDPALGMSLLKIC